MKAKQGNLEDKGIPVIRLCDEYFCGAKFARGVRAGYALCKHNTDFYEIALPALRENQNTTKLLGAIFMSKNVGVTIKLPFAQRQLLHKKAKKAGISLTKLLIKTTLNDQTINTKEQREALLAMIFELHKSGNNLNQIARNLNSSKLTNAPPPHNFEIRQAVAEMKEVVEAIKKLL